MLFAHGSGSRRHGLRNEAVASSLNADGFATLLLDLITAEEEAFDRHTGYYHFDVDLLADLRHLDRRQQSRAASGRDPAYAGAHRP